MRLRRYEALDSMRGICACIVALFHFHTMGNVTNFSLVRHGWIFVDFFFVLSGFVIASAYFDRISDGFSGWRFLALRIGRIYPLHLFVLALLVAMELVIASGWAGTFSGREAFDGDHGVAALFAAIGLVNAVGLFDGLGWNGPSWSIGAEMMAYMTFALLVGIFRRRAIPIFAMAAIGTVMWIAATSPDWLNTTYQLGFVRCLYGFSLGVLLHRLVGARDIHLKGRAATVAQLVVCTAVIAFVVLVGAGPLTLAGPLLFAVTVFVFAISEGEGVISRALCWGPLLMVGTLSYSIYLLHAFVEGRFMDLMQLAGQITGTAYTVRTASGGDMLVIPGIGSDLLTVLMLAVLIGVSWLTYRYVEAPGRSLTRRWVMRGVAGMPEQPQPETRAPAF